MKRRIVIYKAGRIILREGDLIDQFYIIQSGKVQLSREVNGKFRVVDAFGPGDPIGVLGVIQGTPQYTSVEALERTILYRMNFEELMDSAEGREQSVSAVLLSLTDKLRSIVENLMKARIKLEGLEH